MSIDDFYYSRDELKVLKETRYASCKILHGRGLPGTHSLELLKRTLDKLINLNELFHKTGTNATLKIPTYDKSSFNGEGDRMSKSEWTPVNGPIDIIILEGWMLGFQAIIDPLKLQKLSSDMPMVNNELQKYQELWKTYLQARILLKPESISYIQDWRWQQEETMHHIVKSGMTKEQCQAFVDRFLPCYDLYFNDYSRSIPEPHLTLTLNKLREIVTNK